MADQPVPSVFIVQADHWSVRGRPMFAFASEDGAQNKAAEIVNGMVAEMVASDPTVKIKPDATADTWVEVLNQLQRKRFDYEWSGLDHAPEFDPDRSDFSVWVLETNLLP